MRNSIAASLTLCLLLLTACGQPDDDENGRETPAATPADNNDADSMASNDPAAGGTAATDVPDPEQRPVMQAQVVLERLGFGPGVIDGETGMSLANAVRGFQESRDLPVTGELDDPTRQALARWDNIPATRVVTIPQSWGEIEYVAVPEGAEDQAKLKRLGYESIAEKLAERFHTTPEVLARLNPGGKAAGASAAKSGAEASQVTSNSDRPVPVFSPGQSIRVPNVGADRISAREIDDSAWLETLRSLGVGTNQPSVARLVVDESESWLKAYDKSGTLVAMFTVTSGSSRDPLPIGEWGINGVAYNPTFTYNPELLWDVPDSADKEQLPPGPNGPVGVVWIDLTKEHYGIHGTPAPDTIGRAQSHGCVRLTNWDAARLALMVSGDTEVIFQK